MSNIVEIYHSGKATRNKKQDEGFEYIVSCNKLNAILIL